MEKKAAVIPSTGMGEALLMMVASHALFKRGYEVTTYHPKLSELQEWFVGHRFAPAASLDILQKNDLIILQNNNSLEVASLFKARLSKELSTLSLFYPTYKEGKHPPLSSQDRVFDGKKTMVENIAEATASLFDEKKSSIDNGLIVLPSLTHRLHRRRVAIQPISTDLKRTWLFSSFLKVARKLKKEHFQPVFILTPQEREHPIWKESGIEIPFFKTLSELAAYVYESGFVIGNDSLLPHLASNLNIPHLVIGHLEDHMRLWRPGWLQGKVLLPSPWIPNVKFFRLRDRRWQQWISVREVLNRFYELASAC